MVVLNDGYIRKTNRCRTLGLRGGDVWPWGVMITNTPTYQCGMCVTFTSTNGAP